MLTQFSRTELLLGKEGMERLKNARVAVFGIGEGLRITQDNLNSKNFYACNPAFDKQCGKNCRR